MAKHKKKRKQQKRPAPISEPIKRQPPIANRRLISTQEFMQAVETIVPGEDMLRRTVARDIMFPEKMAAYERHGELVRQYNRVLCDKGLALTRRAVKSMDLMDMTACIDKPTEPSSVPSCKIFDDPEYVEYLKGVRGADMFYHAIPCFTKGVFQINRDRYILYEIKRLDIPNRTMDVWLHDYGAYQGVWSPGVSGILRAIFSEDQTVTLQTLDEGLCLFSQLYRMLDYQKDLHWPPEDVRVWETIQLPYSETAEKAFLDSGTNNVQEMGRIMLRYAALLNWLLMKNKPKAVRKPRKTPVEASKGEDGQLTGETPKTPPATSQGPSEAPEQPKRLVRRVGMVTVTSAAIPRESTERTVTHYKVAVWKARGGIRRMKSGKLVPFKEGVRHRKALMNPDGTIPQSVIKVTDNRPAAANKDPQE